MNQIQDPLSSKERMFLHEVEEKLEYRNWMAKIPWIEFDPGWQVMVIPPFAGAMVRFLVKNPGAENRHVSVYLDCYEKLGYYGGPHWEVYPDSEGNNARFMMNDTKGLLDAIRESLDKKEGTQ